MPDATVQNVTPNPAPQSTSDPTAAPAVPPAAAPGTDPAKPVVEVDGQLTRHVAELARLRREHAAEAKRAKELEVRAKAAEDYEKARSEASKNKSALKWLEQAGLTYEDASREILGEDAPKPDPNTQKLSALEAELKTLREWKAQQEKDAQTRAVEEYRVGSHKYVEANTEKYPALAKLGKDGPDIVWRVIVNHAKATNGQVLTHEQAAQKVNEHYANLAKIFGGQSETQSAQAAQPAAGNPAPAGQSKETPKTSSLTNNVSSGSSTPPQKITREERMQASIAKLQAEMKAAQASRQNH